MTIKEFFSFKQNNYFWKNIIAMVVAVMVLMFCVLKWLDIYTHHGNAISVPDVKGVSVNEAKAILKNHGLESAVVDSNYVKSMPAGCVLELLPAAGEAVKKGRIIYLTVNTGNVPMYSVPDVADNSSARQARARMVAAGFKLTEDESIAGEKDWVYGVKYNGRELRHGDKVPAGATLTLLVGNGGHVVENDSIDEEGSVNIDTPSGSSAGSVSSSNDDSWF
jgi:beta-lactam-binding protein with PASTA domain